MPGNESTPAVATAYDDQIAAVADEINKIQQSKSFNKLNISCSVVAELSVDGKHTVGPKKNINVSWKIVVGFDLKYNHETKSFTQ